MPRWRNYSNLWCIWPAQPIGLIEIIGGSYLAARPHITYRKLLENLSNKGFAIHAFGYLPNFDHQTQANEAWKTFREAKIYLNSRSGKSLKSIRLGHSLGCKLHLLAPDSGRSCDGLIALSFNNFCANKSIPMLNKFAPKLGISSEFNPDPEETLKRISESYLQPQNLLISFRKDTLDQSKILLKCLRSRANDSTETINLEGDHLTPASTGISQKILGDSGIESNRNRRIISLVDNIYNWSNLKLSP